MESMNDASTLRAWASDLELCFSSEDEELILPEWENIALLVDLAGDTLARSDVIRREYMPHFLRGEALGMITHPDIAADALLRMRALAPRVAAAGLTEIAELLDRVDGYVSRPAPFDHDGAVQAGYDLSCCHWDVAVVAAPAGDGWVVSLNKGTLFIDRQGVLGYERPTYVTDTRGKPIQRRTWRRLPHDDH
jgi:hypothetical protein